MRIHRLSLRKKLALSTLIAAALAAPRPSHATDYSWSGTTNTTWADTTNWSSGIVPTAADRAVFDAVYTNQPDAGVADVLGILMLGTSGPVTVTSGAGTGLTIGASGIDMSATTQDLTLGASATNIVTIGADQTWTVNTGSTLTATGSLSLANRLTLAGGGIKTLSAANTGAGGITLSAGTLNINNAGALGTGQFIITGGTINNSSVGAITVSTNPTMAWNGNFTFGGSQNLNLGTGAVILSANRTVTTNNSGILTVGGGITGATRTITKAGPGTLRLNGVIATTSGGLTVNAGKLIVGSAANTFTGNITINGATAVLERVSGSNGNATSGPFGIGTGTGGVNYKTVTLTNGGTFRPLANFNNNVPTTALPGAGQIYTIGTGGGIFDTPSGVTFTIDDGTTAGATATNGTTAQQLRGTGALTKTGVGTLVLRQQFNFGGTITANAGSINLTGGGGLGLTTAETSILAGAQLNVNGQNSTDVEPLTIVGTGLAATPQGALTNLGASATWSGPVTLGGAATIGTVGSALTLSSTATINTNGNTLTLQNFGAGRLTPSGIISGTGAMVVNGTSTGDVVMGSAHTYTGGTTLNTGSLVAISSNSTGTAGSPTDGPFGAGAAPLVLAGGSLRSGNGASFTIGNAVTLSGDTPFVTVASEKSLVFSGPVTITGGNRTLTSAVGTTVTGTTVRFDGAINDGGNNLGLIKAGLGNVTLSGANTYTGSTTVNAGALQVTGTLSPSTALTVAGTSAFTTISGAANPVTVAALNLGTAATTTTLGLDLGVNTAGSDSINTAAAATTAGTITFGINALPGFGTSPTYALLTAASGLDTATYSLASVPGGFTYSLASSPTMVQLGVTPSAYTGSLYWRGGVNNSWGAYSTGNTNFTTDSTGLLNAGISPDADNSVIFSADGTVGPTIATTLDNNFSVKDLTFAANPLGVTSVGIAPGAFVGSPNSLTITPAAATSGIDVAANAGAITISAPVVLGASQNWDVNGTGANGSSLTVSGGITGDGSNTLEISSANAGIVTLAGVNTYSGQTHVTSGVLQGGAVNSFSPNSIVNITGPGLLQLNGFNNTVANLIGTGVVQNNHASTNGTLTLGDATNATFNGTIQNGAAATLGITKVGTGITTFSGNNTYTGATTINNGTLRAGSATAFNNTSALTLEATGILDLGGFGAAFTSAAGTATSLITNNGVSPATLTLTNQGGLTAIVQNGTQPTSLVITNSLGNFSLNNPLNTFSGGITLTDSVNGTRLSFGTIVAGAYGTGPITIGQASTDLAGLYFSAAGQTLTNPIVMNTSLGNDRPGIRFDSTGNILSGTITANLADALFSTNGTGAVTLTGQITGPSGLTLSNAFGTTITVTLNNGTMSPNNYAGTTNIQSGTRPILVLGAADQIPNGPGTGLIQLDGALRMGGFNETINGLAGAGTLNNDGVAAATITIGDNNATGNTFSGVIQNTGGPLTVAKIGTGTQTLSGANTFSGPVNANGGLLAFSSSTNLGDASATNVINLNGGGISYNTAGGVDLGATRVVTIGAANGTVNASNSLGVLTISGGIGGTGNLTKTGPGKVVVPTPVTLNAGAGGVTVSNGTLQASFGTAGVSTINVGTTGNLQLYNNTAEVLTLGTTPGALTLAGGARLGFDLGATTVSDTLVVGVGGTAVSSGVITLDFTGITGFGPGGGIYNLFQAPSGLSGATYALGTAPNGFNYTINTSDTLISLTTTPYIARYWNGSQTGGSWSAVNTGPVSNFSTLADGSDNTGVVPGATDTVIFSTTNAPFTSSTVIDTTLDGAIAVDSVQFTANPVGITAVSIAPGTGGTLSLTPVSTSGGIRVEANAGAVTISAPLTVGAGQTWNVDGTGISSLDITGNTAFNGPVNKTGAGMVKLSGTNSGSGAITLSEGTLGINSSTAIGTGTLSIAAGTTIDNSSLGAVTLSTNNVQNWKGSFSFTGTQSLNLGTGAVTLTNNLDVTTVANTLTVGGIIGDAGNSRFLTKSGAGTLVLGGNNTYTGATNVNAGVLTANGTSTTSGVVVSGGTFNMGKTGALGAGTLTLNSGTIDNTTGLAVSVANPVAINGNFSFTGSNKLTFTTPSIPLIVTPVITVDNNALAFNGAIIGSVGLTKAGAGALTLAGNNTYTGNTTIQNGTVNLTGTLTGVTTLSAGSQLLAGTAAGNTVLNVSNDISDYFRFQAATNAGANVAYNQTAGTVTFASTQTGNPNNNLAVAGYGYMNLTGGTFKSSGRFGPSNGATSTGVMYIGGTGVFDQTSGEWFLMAYSPSGNGGLASVTIGPGGTLYRDGASNTFGLNMDRANGYAVLNMAGGSFNNGIRAISFGNGSANVSNTTGMLSLAGGTLTIGAAMANGNTAGTGNQAFLNFAGGTLQTTAGIATIIPATAANQTFISTIYGPISNNNPNSINNTSQDFAGGLIVDTMGFNSGLTNPLVAPAADGVTSANLSITGGSGYIGAPMVQFTGGTIAAGGAPATGYALISGGAVTGIVITSPGSYTAPPSVTLTGGGGAGAAVTVGTLVANTSGGITKNGLGTLTLGGANTYTGPVIINAGTLSAAVAGGLGVGGTITFAGGALQHGGTNVQDYSSRFSTANGQAFIIDTAANNVTYATAMSSATGGSLTKLGTGALILTDTQVYDGITTISGGVLQLGATANAGSATGLLPTGTVIVNNGTLRVNKSTNDTISGVISGTGNLVKLGSGNLTLTGNNTFSGNVTMNAATPVQAGSLTITNSNALGLGPKTVSIVSNFGPNDSSFILDGSSGNITLASDITFETSSANGTGGILNTAGNNTINGNFILKSGGGSTKWIVNGGSLTLGGTSITPNTSGRIAIFEGTANGIVNATIQNGGANVLAVQKNGTGTWTFNGAHTYTGNTTVNDGTLVVTGSLANNSSINVLIAAPDDSVAGNPILTRSIAAGLNTYAGFGSKVTAASIDPITLVGLQTTADILMSNNNAAANNMSMQWRTRTAAEATPTNVNAVLSDVVNINGMGNGTDLFVLQMSYNDAALTSLSLNEAAIANSGELRLGWNNAGTWTTAVNGNTSGTPKFVGQTDWNTYYLANSMADDGSDLNLFLGAYGVNPTNNTVWAVLDHNSEFAVIPEPSTLVLGGLVFLSLSGAGLRKRRIANQQQA